MGRFIIYGAGAIGGVIGSQLFQSGHDVVLVARGAHYEKIATDGLRFLTPRAEQLLPIPVVTDPRDLRFRPDDVVILAMKSQDTQAALAAMQRLAPPEIAIVCAQNGVENERAALRVLPNVYSVVVQLPGTFLQPGVVVATASPVSGILDIGRYPGSVDEKAEEISHTLVASGFPSEPRVDILRWKYTKLLKNLGNALNALTGSQGLGTPLGRRTYDEGVAALTAAGIAFTPEAEYQQRRDPYLPPNPREKTDGGSGSSSWQSLARGTENIEADYLNGEIALLGRTYGVPVPVNALLQRMANQAAREQWSPGACSEEQLVELLGEPALL